MFQTEFEFTLPCGYLDDEGTLHRDGVMRRATAADEILPLKDPRVQHRHNRRIARQPAAGLHDQVGHRQAVGQLNASQRLADALELLDPAARLDVQRPQPFAQLLGHRRHLPGLPPRAI